MFKENIYKIYCILFNKCKYYIVDINNVESISSRTLRYSYLGGSCTMNVLKGLNIKKGKKAILIHFEKANDELISYKKCKVKK